jgi:hypothetical protein
MIDRCFNEKSASFENYGARGITVCDEWKDFWTYAEYVEKTLGAPPSPRHTIDREDNDGDYRPGNIRWASRTEQCVNRRKFKNNSSGYRGVRSVSKSGMTRWIALFDFEGVRYEIGRFHSAEEAHEEREWFVDMFNTAPEFVKRLLASSETVWCTSSTGLRGVTPHVDGGYIARVTHKGVRHYLGYFQTLDEANAARTKFIEDRVGKTAEAV